ncbi:MAG: WecB/TagA/CpsF family glycosyltransferase [Flavobacteriaceae bacterium]
MRTSFLNFPVDLLDLEETAGRAVRAMRDRRACYHVALNVAKLVNARADATLADDIREADIIGIDGAGIVLGLRATGRGNCEKVSGIDLFERLMGECAKGGFRPFLLGATQEVLDAATARLAARHPGLELAGTQHGYFTAAEERDVVARIARSGADCLFVAMPTPRKERFMAAHRQAAKVPFVMGIGGSLDVVAGHTRRAPVLVRRLGMEWFFRMIQEPRRLAGRYLRTNAIYALLLAGEIVRTHLPGGGGRQVSHPGPERRG